MGSGNSRRYGYEEIDSDRLPPADRLAAWRETGRLPMVAEPAGEPEFRIRVRKLSGPSGRFTDLTATPMRLRRETEHCDADGLDMVSLTLMVGVDVQHQLTASGQPMSVPPGHIYVKDFAQPATARWKTPARSLNLHIPRATVAVAIGDKVKDLHGRLLSGDGLAPMLRAQLLTLARLAPQLQNPGRMAALEATIDLAAAVLRCELRLQLEDQANDTGLFAAAQLFIRRHLGYHRLSPELIARHLNCSRAHLYRVFARRDESVSNYIRGQRLQRARDLLAGDIDDGLAIGDIAYRCGFEDPVHFARVFRQRFGSTPRSFRAACRQNRSDGAR
jgi:AraC-like DNA-binding protein